MSLLQTQKQVHACVSCGKPTTRILDLGDQPICNAFLKSKREFENEQKYPLAFGFCRDCYLVQLEKVPPLSVTFGQSFNYLSKATPEALDYFDSMAKKMFDSLGMMKGDAVLDIGSNDGTLLKSFRKLGLETLGVDPSPIPARMANQDGIETICKPFEEAVDEILESRPRLRLITAFNVLAHTDRINDFLKGVRFLCEKTNSFFVSSSHYLPILIQKAEWDTFYHEHARYYTIDSLDRLLSKHYLRAFHAELTNYYGGSFILYASPRWYRRSGNLSHLEAGEARFRELNAYRDLVVKVSRNKAELAVLLAKIKENGKRIVGVGAPMKSSTLLNHCQIGPETLDYLTEVNPLKIGTFSPGSHIPVVPDERILMDQPEYALILSWNLAPRIISDLRSKGYTGSFIMPNPEVRVLQ